jgi:hypothetical protein
MFRFLFTLVPALLAADLFAADPEVPPYVAKVTWSFRTQPKDFTQQRIWASYVQSQGGSGTVIHSKGGESLVITNEHVCPSPDGKFEIQVGRRVYPATWVAHDAVGDLALLKIKEDLPAAQLAERLPEPGEEVWMFGFPGGGPMEVKHGKALPDKAQWKGADLFYSAFTPEPGDSGSGVIYFGADGKGRLVAVNRAVADYYPNTKATGIALENVRKFVSRYIK